MNNKFFIVYKIVGGEISLGDIIFDDIKILTNEKLFKYLKKQIQDISDKQLKVFDSYSILSFNIIYFLRDKFKKNDYYTNSNHYGKFTKKYNNIQEFKEHIKFLTFSTKEICEFYSNEIDNDVNLIKDPNFVELLPIEVKIKYDYLFNANKFDLI